MSLDVSSIIGALLIFVDIIESSKFSSILGPMEYAKKLLNLQQTFERVGKDYFPVDEERLVRYCQVRSRGDEGTIFCWDPEISSCNLVYKAIKFAFELKASIDLEMMCDRQNAAPCQMKIGVGIHYGDVALITKTDKDKEGINRSRIDRLEGYNINYAKRVESCSRMGRYSKIFLSESAKQLIQYEPIVMVENRVDLKGIGADELVYEVRSAFLPGLPETKDKVFAQKFIKAYGSEYKITADNEESWVNGLVLSVLDSRLKAVKTKKLKVMYSDKLSELGWRNIYEEDPVIMYWRARQYHDDGQLTLSLEYYRGIVKNHPFFVAARIRLASVLWEISKQKQPNSNRVFAYNIAKEFLDHFRAILNDDEKTEFENIVNNLN